MPHNQSQWSPTSSSCGGGGLLIPHIWTALTTSCHQHPVSPLSHRPSRDGKGRDTGVPWASINTKIIMCVLYTSDNCKKLNGEIQIMAKMSSQDAEEDVWWCCDHLNTIMLMFKVFCSQICFVTFFLPCLHLSIQISFMRLFKALHLN